jgi:hypothetical protein
VPGFYGGWKRRAPDPRPEPVVPDLTVLVARARDGDYEAVVELAQMSGVTTHKELIELISPTLTVTPLTFDLVCKALEFIQTYPIKEKQP